MTSVDRVELYLTDHDVHGTPVDVSVRFEDGMVTISVQSGAHGMRRLELRLSALARIHEIAAALER